MGNGFTLLPLPFRMIVCFAYNLKVTAVSATTTTTRFICTVTLTK